MTNISSNLISKSPNASSATDRPTMQPIIETESNMRGAMNASASQMPGSSMASEVSNPSAVKPGGDTQIRNKYNDDVSKAYRTWLTSTAAIHAQDESIAEPLAREAVDTRTSIKEAAQANTSFIGRAVAWAQNKLSYGASNATLEGPSKKKDPEEIADSAVKTGGANLGLKGNDPLDDILDTWMAVQRIAPHIYPEHINPEMIQVFKSQPPGKLDPVAIMAVCQTVPPPQDEAVTRAQNRLSYGASNATLEGPSKKKDPEEIADSAVKTSGANLGLKDYDSTDIFNTWMAVQNIAPHINPGDINPEMIQVFKSQTPGKFDPVAIMAVCRTVPPSQDEGRVTPS